MSYKKRLPMFKFTQYHAYKSQGLIHCMVCFVPAQTINCKPPYTKGIKDSCRIAFKPDKVPQTKEELETCLGMSILSWE